MSVGSRRLKVVRLLAEGGFSFVYLVSNSATGERYALKKVLAADKEAVSASLTLARHPPCSADGWPCAFCRAPALLLLTAAPSPLSGLPPPVAQVKATKWEVEVHSSFSHPNLMPLIDHCQLSGTSAQPATEFRLLMPLYSSGALESEPVRPPSGTARGLAPERSAPGLRSALGRTRALPAPCPMPCAN